MIVDCGASLGDYTLLWSKLVGNEGKIIAIEPNRSTYNLLTKNIRANNAKNVVGLNLAVWDKDTVIEMVKMKYSTHDYVSMMGEKNKKDTYKVRSARLDTIARKLKIKKVDLIKIDVEGAEYYVLKGAENTLKKFHPKLIVEVHGRIKGNKKKILNYLRHFNYKLAYKYAVGKNF